MTAHCAHHCHHGCPDAAPAGRATDLLRDEHVVILRGLGRLRALVDAPELDGHEAVRLVHALCVFTDECHHAKEERALFPELEAAGLPRAGGPLGCMLHEHSEGRELLVELRALGAALESRDSAPAPAPFRVAARRYADLIERHIAKENGVLFPMADRLLDADADARVRAAFARFEEEQIGPGRHECVASVLEA
jgi:hemerythrin-like domain-containing protein